MRAFSLPFFSVASYSSFSGIIFYHFVEVKSYVLIIKFLVENDAISMSKGNFSNSSSVYNNTTVNFLHSCQRQWTMILVNDPVQNNILTSITYKENNI